MYAGLRSIHARSRLWMNLQTGYMPRFWVRRVNLCMGSQAMEVMHWVCPRSVPSSVPFWGFQTIITLSIPPLLDGFDFSFL
jgi:hypothetical protein